MMKPNTRTPPAFRITVFNQTATAGRPLGPYIKARFGWFWRVPGTGTFSIKRDHPLADRILQCKRDVVPIRTYYNGEPWDGRVMHAVVEGEPGNEVVTATCIGNLFWLTTFLGWVNPLLPPEFQVALTGKQDVVAGPVDFVLKNFLARAAIRMQKPVHVALDIDYDAPTLPNLSDIRDIDDLLARLGAMTSDVCVLSSRFTRLDELFKIALDDSERGMSMRMWIPEDGPSPKVFSTDTLGRLQNVLNLTKTDNFFWFTNPSNVLGLADPKTWNRLTKPGYIFDTHRKRDRRHVQWRTDNGTISKYKRAVAHPTAHSAIVGGKAPDFVNNIVEWGANAAIKALLNWLIPGLGLGDILIGDLLDDIFFAYQRLDDRVLEMDLGPHGFGEVFADNTNAWSLDGFAVGMTKLKEVGPQETLSIEVQSGTSGGLSFGADNGTDRRFRVGDIMTFWDRGTVIEDYVSGVEVEDSRSGYCTEYVTIGDDRAAKDGWAQLVDRLKDVSAFTRAIANGIN